MIDLSYLNEFLNIDSFNMETAAAIMTAMRQNNWVTLVDLKDTYFHIMMPHMAMKCLHFVVNGKVYQFCDLPFRLANARLIFMQVMSEVAACATERVFSCICI